MKRRSMVVSLSLLTLCVVGCSNSDDGQIRWSGIAWNSLPRPANEGAPRELMVAIDAVVIEIEAADVRAARHALDGQSFVKSAAQLGNHLHALPHQ
jgi:hypothetical protein